MSNSEALYRTRFADRERQRKDEVWQVLCRHFFQDFVRPETATILDVGCGFGEFSRHIRCNRKIAVDLSPEAGRLLAPEVDLIDFSIGNFDSRRIALIVHLGMDLEPLPCRSSGNQTDDHLQTGERLPAPILADE